MTWWEPPQAIYYLGSPALWWC